MIDCPMGLSGFVVLSVVGFHKALGAYKQVLIPAELQQGLWVAHGIVMLETPLWPRWSCWVYRSSFRGRNWGPSSSEGFRA